MKEDIASRVEYLISIGYSRKTQMSKLFVYHNGNLIYKNFLYYSSFIEVCNEHIMNSVEYKREEKLNLLGI